MMKYRRNLNTPLITCFVFWVHFLERRHFSFPVFMDEREVQPVIFLVVCIILWQFVKSSSSHSIEKSRRVRQLSQGNRIKFDSVDASLADLIRNQLIPSPTVKKDNIFSEKFSVYCLVSKYSLSHEALCRSDCID